MCRRCLSARVGVSLSVSLSRNRRTLAADEHTPERPVESHSMAPSGAYAKAHRPLLSRAMSPDRGAANERARWTLGRLRRPGRDR
jgi:hypothetical protein